MEGVSIPNQCHIAVDPHSVNTPPQVSTADTSVLTNKISSFFVS